MLMRALRLGTLIFTAVTAVLFAVIFITTTITKDRTIPTISLPDEVLEVSVSATEEDLLKGVSAYDKKDGDITKRLLVESISRFSETGYCRITYAAFDYDNHVVTASRPLHYTDYTPPKFKLNRSPVFSIYNEVDTNGLVGATDCLDGNISQNVIIYSPDFQEETEGNFSIQATVSNSKGDSSEITLPMIVEKIPRNAPAVYLRTYLVYLKKGSDTPDWNKYITETLDATGVEAVFPVSVKTNINMNKAGVYTVNYYGTDATGMTGHTVLVVVVE